MLMFTNSVLKQLKFCFNECDNVLISRMYLPTDLQNRSLSENENFSYFVGYR